MIGKPAYSVQLQRYMDRLAVEVANIPEQRKSDLSNIAAIVCSDLVDKVSQLVFICTHNSRRSHFAQVWCEVALNHFGVSQVATWSGGTEVTQCNSRTIAALRRAGLELIEETEAANPVYRLRYSPISPAIECFSKIYNQPPNPATGFIALLCCSDVDESCPVIEGAQQRVSLHYQDPKVADDTKCEQEVYDERCLHIATEMYFLASKLEC